MWRTLIALCLASTAVSSAQRAPVQSPHIAGHWTRESDDRITDDASRRRMAHAPDGFCGDSCTIAQSARTLTLVRDTLPNSPTLTFTLDGSASTNTFPTPDGEISMTSRARVDGDHVAIDSDLTRGALHLTEKITAATDRGKLEVDFHSGGRRGGPETVHKQVFRGRQPQP